MVPQQTLAEFYAAKRRQLLPDSLRSGGHFAVFRLEDFAADTALADAYGRRDFYKMALVFTNAQVPYGWEVHGLPYRCAAGLPRRSCWLTAACRRAGWRFFSLRPCPSSGL